MERHRESAATAAGPTPEDDLLARMRDPVRRIAEAEIARFAAMEAEADPCELEAMRVARATALRREVQALGDARKILDRVGAGAGLPPAAALRCAEAGLRRAAEELAPVA